MGKNMLSLVRVSGTFETVIGFIMDIRMEYFILRGEGFYWFFRDSDVVYMEKGVKFS